MSSSRDRTENPLIRDGSHQRQRQTAALRPDFVRLDEQSLADALEQARRLSREVKFYSERPEDSNKLSWEMFFDSSPLVWLALIANTRPQQAKDSYTKALQKLRQERSEDSLRAVLNSWQQEILVPITHWYGRLNGYTPFKITIQGLVKTNLTAPLNRIQRLEQVYRPQLKPFSQTFATALGLSLEANPLPDDLSLGADLPYATVQDSLDTIFQPLFQTYRQIIQEATVALTNSLNQRRDHPPALALYIAFWFVLREARNNLNTITRRHLDFFYRQVLRLPARPATPDQAHLVFELAKSQTEHRLEAGTRFKAGKDASGQPLAYQLDSDTVIHRAQVESLKGLFLDLDESDRTVKGIYASPQADSADGRGGEFSKEETVKAWLPFGDSSRDVAEVGIAISSDIFYLQEGRRTVTLEITLDEQLSDQPIDLSDSLTVELSGEKKWMTVQPDDENSAEEFSISLEGKQLTLELTLSPGAGPVVPYHDKLTGASLGVDQPVLRMLCGNQTLTLPGEPERPVSILNFLQSARLTKVEITAHVEEFQGLVIENDLSIQNPAKPFQPFGPAPTVGSTFTVGSPEIFRKRVTNLELDLTWQDFPAESLQDHYQGYVIPGETPAFPAKFTSQVEHICQRKPTLLITDLPLFENPLSIDLKQGSETQDQGCQEPSGFIRLTLNQDFFHRVFPQKYALQVLAQSKDKGEYVLGAVYQKSDDTLVRYTGQESIDGQAITINEPYTPVIQKISATYSAQASWSDCRVFHLHPFAGFRQIFPASSPVDSPRVLPRFTLHHPDKTSADSPDDISEGSLYIGIANLEPPTALPLLFQVAEDTADPEEEEATVHWAYLKDNAWYSLSDRLTSDDTNGLITSGIVHLGIPEDIGTGSVTLLDPTLHWIKASVPRHSSAVCKILSVHTQAARATFVDQENDPGHLAQPLAAETIAKLELPRAEIKKLKQPYPSFGGQIAEPPPHFHTRVSEHLRHKGRAVTIFDYERLVLENFPHIYKVRCINHGRSQNRQWQGLVPGSVAVAVIPDLTQRLSSMELAPRLSRSQLQEVETFLAGVSSPWVRLAVVNPAYEAVRVECQVAFRPPYSANFGYYQRQLDRDITQFLAPWTRDSAAEISFGGRLSRSAVLNFVEKLSYVDYVLNFSLSHQGDQNSADAIVASTPRSILTANDPKSSVDGLSHSLEPVPDGPPAPRPSGRSDELGYTPLNSLTLTDP